MKRRSRELTTHESEPDSAEDPSHKRRRLKAQVPRKRTGARRSLDPNLDPDVRVVGIDVQHSARGTLPSPRRPPRRKEGAISPLPPRFFGSCAPDQENQKPSRMSLSSLVDHMPESPCLTSTPLMEKGCRSGYCGGCQEVSEIEKLIGDTRRLQFPLLEPMRQSSSLHRAKPSTRFIAGLARARVINFMCYLYRKVPIPLSPHTMQQAVFAFDRFCGEICRKGDKTYRDRVNENLRTIGACCLFVASKIEDTMALCLMDIAVASEGAVSMKSIKVWERRILQVLDYVIVAPSLLDFQTTYFREARIQRQHHIVHSSQPPSGCSHHSCCCQTCAACGVPLHDTDGTTSAESDESPECKEPVDSAELVPMEYSDLNSDNRPPFHSCLFDAKFSSGFTQRNSLFESWTPLESCSYYVGEVVLSCAESLVYPVDVLALATIWVTAAVALLDNCGRVVDPSPLMPPLARRAILTKRGADLFKAAVSAVGSIVYEALEKDDLATSKTEIKTLTLDELPFKVDRSDALFLDVQGERKAETRLEKFTCYIFAQAHLQKVPWVESVEVARRLARRAIASIAPPPWLEQDQTYERVKPTAPQKDLVQGLLTSDVHTKHHDTAAFFRPKFLAWRAAVEGLVESPVLRPLQHIDCIGRPLNLAPNDRRIDEGALNKEVTVAAEGHLTEGMTKANPQAAVEGGTGGHEAAPEAPTLTEAKPEVEQQAAGAEAPLELDTQPDSQENFPPDNEGDLGGTVLCDGEG